MSKKISIGVALSLVLAAITVTFALTMTFSQSIYNKLINTLSGRAEMYSTLEDINALIRTNYYFGSINNENINYSVSNGYVKGLGDPNSRFMTANEYRNYNNRLSGNASGIGITTIWDKNKSKLLVSAVASGSSAAAKGIKPGDVLTKIGDEKVTSKNREELVELLSGDTLSTVNVTCLRDGKTSLEFNVTVGYSLLSVTHKTIGSIGYIRITAFYSNTQEQLKEAITALQDDKVSGIVFDLRGTTDGTIEYAAAAIDCITPVCSTEDEVLATLVGRDGVTVRTYPSTSNNLNLPMAILVNAETAGPAELFACDLRDFGKAVLVGTSTAGIGTAQEVFTLEDGSAVLLTTSKILPYKSESFNDTGLSPNHEVILEGSETVPELIEADKDTQLQKAVAVLSEL